jgi:hypothetical protein
MIEALKSPEALKVFCRHRYDIDVHDHDCADLLRYCYPADGPQAALARLQRRLSILGYFRAGEKPPPEARVSCVLHWPWPSGLPIPWDKKKPKRGRRRRTLAQSKLNTQLVITALPVDRVANRVTGGKMNRAKDP